MHPRRRLQKILDDAHQFVVDVEWWNANRTDAAPMDCEPERVIRELARKAIVNWDRGDLGRQNDGPVGRVR